MNQRLIRPGEVESSGDWAKDNAAGRALAEVWLSRMRGADHPGLLFHAARATGEGRQSNGITVGFWGRVGGEVLARA